MGKTGTQSLTTFRNILVKDISLDLENPRYAEAQMQLDIKTWTDKKLQEYIVSEDISDIRQSIRAVGIKDPVWVIEKSKGKYIMVEGSRRLATVRTLVNEKPPNGVSFKTIPAHVYPKNTNEKKIHAQKIILQTGKRPWGAFNTAKSIYNLINDDNFTIIEAARMWKKSVGTVEKELENYQYYKEFSRWMKKKKGDATPRHYSYFQKASLDVREKLFNTKPQREKFYKLITPNKKGITRIPNVSLKGGLIKTFNKFATNENVLQSFMKNERITSDQALLEFKGGDIKHEFPWTSKLKDIQTGINKLTKDDIKKIKAKEPAIYNMIVKISMSTTKMVEKK